MKHCRQQHIRSNLMERARILRAVRRFFETRNFLEVEPPLRIPAPAPETHIDAVASEDWFLQTSPELCMKRLLAAGYERIFHLGKCFRRKERGRRHLPELTLLEWYWAGATLEDMLHQTEELVTAVAGELGHRGSIRYQNTSIDLDSPWPHLPVADAFQRFTSVSMAQALADDTFDERMACEIEPCLDRGRPVFLVDYPASKAALARLKPGDPSVAERFELYIGGLELCNAFGELIDPVEQRTRFEAEQIARRRAGRTVYPMPEKFLSDLQHMPPAAGNALGMDRLVMLLVDAADIDNVVAFTPEEL